MDNKIIHYPAFDRRLLPKNKKVVLVGGCFDIFHYGHLTFLKKARSAGDYLIIALESDESTKRKGRSLFHNQKQRAELLAGLEIVDLVLLLPDWQNNSDYFNLVKKIQPQVIAVSDNDPKYELKKEQANLVKAEIKVVTPLLIDYSSSKIKEQYESFSRD